MCGICGAVLKDGNAAFRAYEGLKKLEYRGYDSVGIAVLGGGKISIAKRGGRVESIEEEVKALRGGIAIGHTRWATHGAPTDLNAHPHYSGDIAVVHNGMIDNFKELKRELENKGFGFYSETDSEVIAKLIDSLYDGDFLDAVCAAVRRLKGSYAIAAVHKDFDGIIAVKHKSPLVVGFSDDGAFISSDVPALDKSVTSVCFPEEDDVAVLSASSVGFYDTEKNGVNRVRSRISAGQFEVGKGKYAYFMEKEIAENAKTVEDTADCFLRNVDVKKLNDFIRSADRIILTGCGTAYNAALAARRFFMEICGVDCIAEIASELRYLPVRVTRSTLVIAVTQSGETADTIEAVAALKTAGARAVAVTNCGYSAITRSVDLVVPVCAGAEICVAATKSYTGQLAALYLMANLAVDVFEARRALSAVATAIDKVLTDEERALSLAKECTQSSAVFFLGRGADYPVAVEASLKLKEVSYIFSDGYPSGELKHGTLALVNQNTFGIFIICQPELCDVSVNAVEQVTSRGGKAAVITCFPAVAQKVEGSASVWMIPECPSRLSAFVSAVALQSVAYRAAVLLGRDPDKPRNLAKSVTVL